MSKYLVVVDMSVEFCKVVEADSMEHAEELLRELYEERDGLDEEIKNGLKENLQENLADVLGTCEIYCSETVEPGSTWDEEEDVLRAEEDDI